MYALGVDLGTTFTAAAVWREGRAEMSPLGMRTASVPSVVLARPDGGFLVGEAAARRAALEPGRVAREFKRRLGDSTPLLLGGSPFSAEALTARLLDAVVSAVSDREGGRPDSICLCHPANWGPFKTDLLRQAVQLADLAMPVVLITEPEAAAISYARQERLAPGDTVAVYDLGGGTFDAAVLRRTARGFEILGQPEGIERLGGIDVDAAVFSHVARAIGAPLAELDEDDPVAVSAVARLREDCTSAKEALSSDTDVAIPVLLPTVTTEVRLTRAELEDMVRPSLYDSIESLKRAVRSAGVAAEDLSAVLLVGGSSRMPLVAQLVGNELGRPVAVDAHPKHAVALGAAWRASGVALPADPDGPAPATAVVATSGRPVADPRPVTPPRAVPAPAAPPAPRPAPLVRRGPAPSGPAGSGPVTPGPVAPGPVGRGPGVPGAAAGPVASPLPAPPAGAPGPRQGYQVLRPQEPGMPPNGYAPAPGARPPARPAPRPAAAPQQAPRQPQQQPQQLSAQQPPQLSAQQPPRVPSAPGVSRAARAPQTPPGASGPRAAAPGAAPAPQPFADPAQESPLRFEARPKRGVGRRPVVVGGLAGVGALLVVLSVWTALRGDTFTMLGAGGSSSPTATATAPAQATQGAAAGVAPGGPTTAPMTAPPGMLAVAVQVTGRGTVTSTDGRISCPGSCRATIGADEHLTLVASGTGFLGWSQCPQRDGDRCTVGGRTGTASPVARFAAVTTAPPPPPTTAPATRTTAPATTTSAPPTTTTAPPTTTTAPPTTSVSRTSAPPSSSAAKSPGTGGGTGTGGGGGTGTGGGTGRDGA